MTRARKRTKRPRRSSICASFSCSPSPRASTHCVGISFSFLQIDIVAAALIIGCTTFVLSLVGVVVGNRFGARFERPSQIAGGIVLIAIGLKILLEHLGLIAF